MRRWTLCLILAGIALPAFAANRVTVEQLEQALATATVKSDAYLAGQLSALELTERLSTARLEQLRAGLPGEKSQQALLALADSAAFLAPPAAEMPATATPDRAAQRRILSLTVDYLGKTLPLLPHVFAARDTMRFESRPAQFQEAQSDGNPLHEVATTRVTVLYRDGKEFIEAGADKDKKAQAPDKGLTTWGEFGPILGTVLIDAARSKLSWARWELGAGGPQAVFQYSVPKETSHYDVRFCCVAESYGFKISVLSQRVGYHGEISVDPDSGTILRLTVLADLDPGNPIARADVAVEYGQVEFGGKTYYCPVRGIALAQAPDLKSLHGALPSEGPAGSPPTVEKASFSIAQVPRQTLLNDVVFRNYHLFRADTKIVTGNEAQAANHLPAPSLASSTSGAQPAEEAAVESSTLAPLPAAATTAASQPPSSLAAAPPPEPLIPEITVASATGLPDAPALAQAGTDSLVTLRLSARLVDVPLVAFDKKGPPNHQSQAGRPSNLRQRRQSRSPLLCPDRWRPNRWSVCRRTCIFRTGFRSPHHSACLYQSRHWIGQSPRCRATGQHHRPGDRSQSLLRRPHQRPPANGRIPQRPPSKRARCATGHEARHLPGSSGTDHRPRAARRYFGQMAAQCAKHLARPGTGGTEPPDHGYGHESGKSAGC